MYFFNELRQEMRDYLENIFGQDNVDMVSAPELINGVTRLIKKTGTRLISIDKVYFPTHLSLEINRIVDSNLRDTGLGPRFGFAPIQFQVEKIAKNCPAEITLVDDVIFSGNGMSQIINLFSKHNIMTKSIVAGIIVGNGFEYLKQKEIEIRCVRFYPEIIDEICERDFYPGVPMSGRLVAELNHETGAPYLLPFGKPKEWASIPAEKAKDFSIFCLNQSIKLWKEIEKVSNKYVLVSDLARRPFGITDKSIRITEALKKAKEML